MFPVRGQGGVGLGSEQTASLPRCVFHAAEQLVVGVLWTSRSRTSYFTFSSCQTSKREEPHLDDAAVVVGEVWQRRLVLVQRVVAGVGVVMMVTVRNVCRNKTNL